MSQQRNDGCDEAPQTEKANWEQALTAIFLEICVERVKAGDRPNTHFTRDGWKKIISSFFDKTGKLYDQPQFKNKWNNLKKDWRVWEKLVIGETGLGWDNTRETVVADNEWWEPRQKVRKVRNHGIENREALQFLFGGQGATGLYALNPSANEPEVPDAVQPGNDDVHLSKPDDSNDPEYDAGADVGEVNSSPTPPVRVGNPRRRSNAQGNRGRQKRRVNDVRAEISQSFSLLASAVQSRTQSTAQSCLHGCIEDVCSRLEEIPETTNGGPLLAFALKLFENKEHRIYFNGINRPEWQVTWLKTKYEEVHGPGSADHL
ncbi:L10-interacting MYB domain-containing protein-like [Tripterygium wilfordii]|uniref:L10-interacting MYB domain-containing protein-like n=1 Tax=Tripterygium wilfordii TaxID=458696 RepID=UPI0018F7F8F6|nr:L10-interacting MYB domain-containing protein-like [Tripterygium wilfordii]